MDAGPVARVPRRRRRWTLATRISLLSIGIAVATALVAGSLGTSLVRKASTDSAQSTLAKLADVAASAAGRRTPAIARRRLKNALHGLEIRFGAIQPNGSLITRSAIVRETLDPLERLQITDGSSVSTSRDVGGRTVLVEARPVDGTTASGIVLVQPRSDATAQAERAIRLFVLALLIAAAAAALVGLVVAWRLARPLRRTAAAAHSVAAGNRDVALPAQGPAEVVEVSEAVTSIAGALRHSEARQQQFLMSVSHDLRTPLTAISGYAESLADGVIEPADAPQVGAVLVSESKRLERMVGDLLDLARLGAADFRVDFVAVDVADLVRAAAKVWSTRCAASDVRFELEVPTSPLVARSDGSRLRQLLDGLFDNALRVTPAGAVIVLAARVENRAVLVEVRDGGPGLTDADLQVAFDQGVLHDRYRGVRQVGTGLGLAIVHGLVARLGAGIEAGHATEGGARFTVRLPPA